MQRKFRLNDDAWKLFLSHTDTPSETLRDLVLNYCNEDYPLNMVMGVQEASVLWSLSPGTIKNYCASGKIKAKNIGNTWVIDKTQPNPSKSSL